MRGQEAIGTCRENKPASLHRPLMLDNGISAPQVSKFSRHLPTDPLHDPYFIQSVGLRGPLELCGISLARVENDRGVSSLARVWQ